MGRPTVTDGPRGYQLNGAFDLAVVFLGWANEEKGDGLS